MGNKSLNIGRALRMSFDLCSPRWRPLLGLAAICAIANALAQRVAADIDPARAWSVLLLQVFSPILLGMILSATFATFAAELRAGARDLTLREMFSRTLARHAPLLSTSVLTFICVLLGLVVFIAGGVVVGVFLTLVAPVVMLEETSGPDALSRSVALVKGVFWPLVALLLVGGLVAIFAGAIGGAVIVAVLPSGLDAFAASFVFDLPVMLVAAILPVVAYFQLIEQEQAGEGADPPLRRSHSMNPAAAEFPFCRRNPQVPACQRR